MSGSICHAIIILIMEGIYQLYFTVGQLQYLDPRWQILRISHEWDCFALKWFRKKDHFNKIICWWDKPLKNPGYDNRVPLWSTYKYWVANVLYYIMYAYVWLSIATYRKKYCRSALLEVQRCEGLIVNRYEIFEVHRWQLLPRCKI